MAISEMISKDAEILDNLNPMSFREQLTNRSSLTKMSSPSMHPERQIIQSESKPSSKLSHY